MIVLPKSRAASEEEDVLWNHKYNSAPGLDTNIVMGVKNV